MKITDKIISKFNFWFIVHLKIINENEDQRTIRILVMYIVWFLSLFAIMWIHDVIQFSLFNILNLTLYLIYHITFTMMEKNNKIILSIFIGFIAFVSFVATDILFANLAVLFSIVSVFICMEHLYVQASSHLQSARKKI